MRSSAPILTLRAEGGSGTPAAWLMRRFGAAPPGPDSATGMWFGPAAARVADPMDQSQAPLLDALADYHELDRYGFTPPGHRQGRGIDPRVREVMGVEPFRDDVLASSGLDDRSSSGGYLQRAEELMADAVGAEHAFFSTCGSSLSVKAAMLAVAGHDGQLLLSRDAHKSVVAGLIFSGLRPRWISPRWDARAAPRPPALARAGRGRPGSASRRRRRADRQPDPVRHLRRHRRRSPRSATSAASR